MCNLLAHRLEVRLQIKVSKNADFQNITKRFSLPKVFSIERYALHRIYVIFNAQTNLFTIIAEPHHSSVNIFCIDIPSVP